MHHPDVIINLPRLIEVALLVATVLGHSLRDWEPGLSRRNRVTTCSSCGLFAVVSTAPDMPRLDGSVLSVECRGKHTRPAWSRE